MYIFKLFSLYYCTHCIIYCFKFSKLKDCRLEYKEYGLVMFDNVIKNRLI